MDDKDHQNIQPQQKGPAGCFEIALKSLAWFLLIVAILFGLVFGWCALGVHH